MDIEPYLEAIKKNELGMVPLNIESTYDMGRPLSDIVVSSSDQLVDPLATTGGGRGLSFKPFDTDGKLYFSTSDPDILPIYINAGKAVKS